MKTILMAFLAFLFTTPLIAQTNNEEASNMTILRLTIIKDHKILMRNTENGWMTPAIYYTKQQNIHEALDSLATQYGIKISNPNLGGLFTYKYKFKSTSDMRQIYVAQYQNGDLKSPNDKEKVEWMPIEEAISKLSGTVSSMGEMTRQILNFPTTLWGGSFILNRINGKLVSKVEEAFYPLRDTIENTPETAVTKKIDNHTVQYLILFNDKKEVLMLKNKFGWHTPAMRSDKIQSIKEALDSLAATMGYTIDNLQLAGLYSYKYEGFSDHKDASFRSHYTAKIKTGNLIQPPPEADKEYHWMPVEEALQKITFESSKLETTQILKNPNKLWGGSFLIILKDDKYFGSRVLEKPYILRDDVVSAALKN